jgi:hypothetical protein
MKYTVKQKYSGDAEAAIKAIEATLLPNSFQIQSVGQDHIELTGRAAQSTRESPLRGATRIVVRARGGHLHLDAELGGVKRLAAFVCVFPILLWLGLGAAALIKAGEASSILTVESVVGAGIWLLLGPLLGLWVRKRTVGALDTMLANAVVSAKRERAGV